MRFERRSDVRPTACRISEQTPSISSSWTECPCLVMDWSMYGHKGHKEPERPLRPTTHTNIRYRIYYTLHTVPVGISLELRSIGTDGVLPVLFCTACRGLGLYILFVHCTVLKSDLPPIRPHCGGVPRPRFQPGGTGELEAGTLTTRPPHLLNRPPHLLIDHHASFIDHHTSLIDHHTSLIVNRTPHLHLVRVLTTQLGNTSTKVSFRVLDTKKKFMINKKKKTFLCTRKI